MLLLDVQAIYFTQHTTTINTIYAGIYVTIIIQYFFYAAMRPP